MNVVQLQYTFWDRRWMRNTHVQWEGGTCKQCVTQKSEEGQAVKCKGKREVETEIGRKGKKA